MTNEEMNEAGTICEKEFHTNEELDKAIKGTELALEYLKGRGVTFALAIRPLRAELANLRACKDSRKVR